MARSSSSRSSDIERWQRQQTKEAERQRREAAAADKAAEKAQREQRLTDRKADAARRSTEVEARAQQLATVLVGALRHPARIDFAGLKRQPNPPAFSPGSLAVSAAEPAWEQFAPARPGVIGRLFGGQARHDQQVPAARATFDSAVDAWQTGEDNRRQRLVAAQHEHSKQVTRHVAEVAEHNSGVDKLARDVRARERKAVESMLGAVLTKVPLPADFPRRAEVTYNPTSEQVVVRVELPGRDLVPTVRGYKYIQARDEIQAVPRPAKESADLYRSLVAQVALLVIAKLFEADPQLASIGFNGHVDATNPGTGQREYPCLISLNVERATFAELVLDQITPEVCLRHLNALVSRHPYELEPVTPILDFDLSKYSFVEGMDAVSSLDSRPDLIKMSPTEFEHLVKEVFTAMGLEGWTTTQSKDDGVDAVVLNRSPLVGGLSIVQAKRYKDVVGVSHIRELAGAMEEKRAGRGILVTTSWFTPGGHQKAREHGRIELINGQNLVSLIKEHLGKDVLIGIRRPRNTASRPAD